MFTTMKYFNLFVIHMLLQVKLYFIQKETNKHNMLH